MRSEAGGVTSGIDLTGLAKWVSGKLSRKQGGGSVAQDEDIHKW
jgi:hypothetical protein